MRKFVCAGLCLAFLFAGLAQGQTITSVDPNSAPAGSSDLTLTVTGSGFISSDGVYFGIYALPTTFVNSTTLTAALGTGFLGFDGSEPIQVGSASRASNTVTFHILAPIVSALAPNTASPGQSDFTLTVNGSNFVPASIVVFNGKNLTTNYVGPNQLTAAVTSDLVATAQTVSVMVVSAYSKSNTVSFVIGGSGTGGGGSPSIADVFNSFTMPGAAMSPGVLAEVAGTNLADSNQYGPLDNPIVLVNGEKTLIESTTIYQGSSYILFQIPFDTPVGQAQVVVQNDGVSSTPKDIVIDAYSPAIDTYVGTYFGFHADNTQVTTKSPAIPGEVIRLFVDGLGAGGLSSPTSLAIDGSFVPSKVQQITLQGGLVGYEAVYTVPALSQGMHAMVFSVNGIDSPTIHFPVGTSAPGALTVSQTGTTFRAVAGSVTTLERDVSVGGTGAPINWVAFPTTFSGGDWLQVSPTTGTSSSFQTPVIQITTSASKLQAGDYFGQITIRPTDGSATQIISVVLSVLSPAASPGPALEPTGMIFVSSPNNVPPAQNTQITNPSTGSLTFSTTVQVSGSSSLEFDVEPASGSVSPGPPQSISVQPVTGLPAGVYSAAINFSFSDGSKRAVNVLWVVAEGAGNSLAGLNGPFGPTSPRDNGACTPSKLLAVFTALGENFSAPVAYPASISALVVDDCGTPLVNGSVTLTFSNLDSMLEMKADSSQAGSWNASWVPSHPVTSDLVVTLNAESSSLKGSVHINGSAPTNPNVPIVYGDGVDTAANYGHILAPGVMISIFGDQFAANNALSDRLPLPTEVSTGNLETAVELDGAALPIYYVSKGQINALVPYGISKGTGHLIVTRGSAFSTDVPVVILSAAPGVFTRDQTGKGAGVIFGTTPKGINFTPAPAQPAHAGDALTVYCAGLGELKTPLTAGFPAPSDPAIETANKVTATLGGAPANVEFAGLVPGFAGLYQVNVRVPTGVPTGDQVALVLTVAGQNSSPVTVAVR